MFIHLFLMEVDKFQGVYQQKKKNPSVFGLNFGILLVSTNYNMPPPYVLAKDKCMVEFCDDVYN